MVNDAIYTLKEAAEYLKISYLTALRLAKRAALPFFKVGGQWRIRKEDLDRFITGKTQPAQLGGTPSPNYPGAPDLPARAGASSQTGQRVQSLAIIPGLSTRGGYPIYFKIQVLNRYKDNPKYIFEEDASGGCFALKEEYYKTTGSTGIFWANIREIKFQKIAVNAGIAVVCLDAEYYSRVVKAIVYEYRHWHNYRIHTPLINY